MTTWITDANNNRCSIDYWGSREKAQEALDSLKDCSRCSDCSDCSDCSRCSRCSNCSDCSDCSDCSRCSRCSNCSDCSYCSRCSRCSNCSDCSYCSGCSGCADCSRCSECAECAGKAEPFDTLPPVPVIPDIHQAVFEAVSQPHALNMSSWHTCNTTHCRGGWVVALAGEAGKTLEEFHNTELAAMLIYQASGYEISPVRFHESNEVAMEDMRRLAAGEAA